MKIKTLRIRDQHLSEPKRAPLSVHNHTSAHAHRLEYIIQDEVLAQKAVQRGWEEGPSNYSKFR